MNFLIGAGIALMAFGLFIVVGTEQGNGFGLLVFLVGVVVTLVGRRKSRPPKAWPTTET
jgi:hypothetical protein